MRLGIALFCLIVWALCALMVIALLASHSIGEEDQFLRERFPNSPNKRKVWGTLMIVAAPLTLFLVYAYLFMIGAWKLLNGDFIRWLKKATGM